MVAIIVGCGDHTRRGNIEVIQTRDVQDLYGEIKRRLAVRRDKSAVFGRVFVEIQRNVKYALDVGHRAFDVDHVPIGA